LAKGHGDIDTMHYLSLMMRADLVIREESPELRHPALVETAREHGIDESGKPLEESFKKVSSADPKLSPDARSGVPKRRKHR
jgi:hypothetical protein